MPELNHASGFSRAIGMEFAIDVFFAWVKLRDSALVITVEGFRSTHRYLCDTAQENS